MSILKKPYTISVWDDVWDGEKFVEKRLGIIGSDKMTAQCRAIEPNLVRNVNGSKKFSFKMYKHYVDIMTGEKVENPFIGWLISERKVKLEYKGKWYDFIIKDINENSSNYLYTYQLEDALVQELSKNGFGVTLDAVLMNNLGTAEKLATEVLTETDWHVSSEKFVQKVEEALVYATFPWGIEPKHISDQSNLNAGIDDSTTKVFSRPEGQSEDSKGVALVFYSSCTGKPHRFQFIVLGQGLLNDYAKASVSIDNNRNITVPNCQYYIDYPTPYNQYKDCGGGYWLPEGWSILSQGSSGVDDTTDSTLSTWYRGERYGFAHQVEFIPLLDRYCNKYKVNGEDYYGYIDNEYVSPTLVQNFVTNYEFKGTSGWTASYYGTSPNAQNNHAPELLATYGIFRNNKFQTVLEELQSNRYIPTANYLPYLKTTIKKTTGSNNTPIILNSGFYDNRTLIKQVNYGEEWILKAEVLDNRGTALTDVFSNFDFKLREVLYDTRNGYYCLGNIWAEIDQSGNTGLTDNTKILKFNSAAKGQEEGYANVLVSEDEFKNKKIQLVITPKNVHAADTTYYIKDIQLFKKHVSEAGNTFLPGYLEEEGVVVQKHYLFPKSLVIGQNAVASAKEIPYTIVEQINYETYIPVYNDGAEKVRTVNIKESNYFNILQSIAETFEAWLDLEITRDDFGGISSKTVHFKNYSGKNNYAYFQYGVNLKEVQRAYGSKNIVTKLIVKQNNNQYGKDGFCTIARSNSNPTGENYIYDFSYYDKRGLLRARDYLDTVYDKTGATGPDLGEGHEGESYNLQGYFLRIKDLNKKIISLGTKVGELKQEIVTLEAKKQVQQAAYDAAQTGLQQVTNDFYVLSGGIYPTQISQDDFTSITSYLLNADGTGYSFVGTGGEKSLDFVKSKISTLNRSNLREKWAQNAEITQVQLPATGGATNSIEFEYQVSIPAVAAPELPTAIGEPTGTNYVLEVKEHAPSEGELSWENETYKLTNPTNGYRGLKITRWGLIASTNEGDGTVVYEPEFTYRPGEKYKFVYTIKPKASEGCLLKRIGGHMGNFTQWTIDVYYETDQVDEDGTPIREHLTANWEENPEGYIENPDGFTASEYEVVYEGIYTTPTDSDISNNSQYFFIQPNRGLTGADANVECVIELSSMSLYKYGANTSAIDRTFKFQPLFELQLPQQDKNLIANSSYSVTQSSQGNFLPENYLRLASWQNIQDLAGQTLTFSYILKRPSCGETAPTSHTPYGERFGIHGCAKWKKPDGSQATMRYPFAESLETITTNTAGERQEMVYTLTPPEEYSVLEDFWFAVQTFAKPIEDGEIWEIKDIQLEIGEQATEFTPHVSDTPFYRTPVLSCTIPAYQLTGKLQYTLSIVDTQNSKIADLLEQFTTYQAEINKASRQLYNSFEFEGFEDGQTVTKIVNKGLDEYITEKEEAVNQKLELQETLLEHKTELNKKFFTQYSRFIQEGTWINEEYTDDDVYYADAQSVLYNSCWPQVGYNISVLALGSLPGYEMFDYEIGDKTWVVDKEFFGADEREEVIISESSEMLDDPSSTQFKVQNFKNQFQDLFQKITATVQETKYSTGAYKKAVALAEASAEKKNAFVSDALGMAAAKLEISGQDTVTQDGGGITITNPSTQDKLRLLGGAILMGKNDENGQFGWKTGLTADGISASLVTAGTINAGVIEIKNAADPVFKWNAFGITAFDTEWHDGNIASQHNPFKFVRFDKHGIYGINSDITSVNGESWTPNGAEEIDAKASFALTYEGLKVNGDEGVILRIGRNTNKYDSEGNALSNKILEITKTDGDGDSATIQSLMSFSNDGTLTVGGWSVSQNGLENYVQPTTSTFRMRRALSEPEKNVYLCSTPKEETFLANDEEHTKDVLLRVGDHFRVTKDGELFASAGIIGGVTIGSIASTNYADNAASTAVNNLEIGGKNLIKLANITSGNCTLNKNSTNNIQVTNVSTGNTSAILINEEYPEGTYVFNATSTKTNKTIRMLFNYQYDDNCTYNAYYDSNYHYPYYRDNTTLPFTLTLTQPAKIGFVVLTDSGDQTISALKLEKGNKATDWTPAPEDVQAEISATNSLVEGVRTNLQNQIDGAITSWFEEGAPISLGENVAVNENPPSDSWTTDNEKIKHEGDLYYDTNTQYCFRWTRQGTDPNYTWTWVQIADEGISEALTAANNAQATADGKMTVFSTTPNPPYQIGDLWAQGGTGELMRCVNGKDSGDYDAADWEKASKYTDDTVANQKVNLTDFDGLAKWDFNPNKGLLMWGDSPKISDTSHSDYGDFAKDSSLVFKIGKINDVPTLQMRGSGEFTGELKSGTPVQGKYPFHVDLSGNVTMNGNIQLGGNITWSASSSPTQVLYNASNDKGKPSGLYKEFVDGTNGWYKTQSERKYASYTYDGGNTWGEIIQIVGEQGPQGIQGIQGGQGAAGRGIASTEIKYQKHTSGTSAPTGAWQNTIPTIGDDEFLWTRTIIMYTDNKNPSTSYSVSAKGSQGPQGQQGIQGPQGAQGIQGIQGPQGTSVTIVSTEYARGSSSTTIPSSGWQPSPPSLNGTYPYLWARTNYSDDSNLAICAKNYVTKDDLWQNLGDNDGIYNNNGNIAIRASAIISGALQVGGTKGEPDSEGTVFYADVTDASKVRIAGFQVSSSAIEKTAPEGRGYDFKLSLDYNRLKSLSTTDFSADNVKMGRYTFAPELGSDYYCELNKENLKVAKTTSGTKDFEQSTSWISLLQRYNDTAFLSGLSSKFTSGITGWVCVNDSLATCISMLFVKGVLVKWERRNTPSDTLGYDILYDG